MPKAVRPSFPALAVRAQLALGMSQTTLGNLLGLSRATIGRWSGGRFAGVSQSALATLVAALYPVDPALATEVAASRGETLESLGVVAPQAPLPAPPPPTPPPPALEVASPVPVEHLVDSVVCAAADAASQLPAALRPSLLAAFERARSVGLSVDAVVDGLRRRASGD